MGGGSSPAAAAAVELGGPGPAASAADMPCLVGALERLVEAYIELAMVGWLVRCAVLAVKL